MSAKEKRRQKQLQRKSAKRKAKQREIAKSNSRGLAAQFRDIAAIAPIVDCFLQGNDESGMKQVLISRRMPDGRIAFAIFLVDQYCLGIKNAMGEIQPKPIYEDRYRQRLFECGDIVAAKPADALKLIVDAVDYAEQLGFHPHPDFRRCLPIFTGVDPDDSQVTFEFGRQGKPFFISGPNDDHFKCKRIINTLLQNCGEGNFHYLIGGESMDAISELLMPMSSPSDDRDVRDWDAESSAGDDPEDLPRRRAID